MRSNRRAAISADRDKWTKQAFDACVVAIKDLIRTDGLIRPEMPIGHLTTSELGWFASAGVSAWVRTRSEQAATEGWNYECACHATMLEPDPWLEGAIAAVLPKLADACPGLDWSKPINEWSKDHVVEFLLAAFNLIQHALAARDAAESPPGSGGVNPDLVARELNALAGNPLMTIDEFRGLGEDLR
jgi:hypothetical protein